MRGLGRGYHCTYCPGVSLFGRWAGVFRLLLSPGHNQSCAFREKCIPAKSPVRPVKLCRKPGLASLRLAAQLLTTYPELDHHTTESVQYFEGLNPILTDPIGKGSHQKPANYSEQQHTGTYKPEKWCALPCITIRKTRQLPANHNCNENNLYF